MLDEYQFALCLTHDVDRPFKGLRSLYYALRDRPLYHLQSALRRENPYWQFDAIMALEDELGVRSAFYFLNEPSVFALELPEWFKPVNWIQHLGRYDITTSPVADVIGDLDAGGWEVGLHGSYHSARHPTRLAYEKQTLEAVLGGPVSGCRQHYLRLSRPETWRRQADIGLRYDSSLGSGTTYGFQSGAVPFRPFDDEFMVFPLTMMDQAVMADGPSPDAVWAGCERVLSEAAERGAVVTVDWHQRVFDEREFPGYRETYRRIIERAQAAGAWVGPPGDLYDELAHRTPVQP